MKIVSMRCVVVLTLLTVVCLLGSGCAFNRAATGPTLAEQVADAYGIARWDEVSELTFTYNAQGNARRVTRTWTWEPKAKRVTYEGPGPDNKHTTLTYHPFEIGEDSEESLRLIDHWFMSDQYWLLFPFHLVWDEDVSIAETGEQPLPVGDGNARQLVVTFNKASRYMPGAVYELYIGDDNRIVQWVVRRGGTEDSFISPVTWEVNTEVGPIMVSTEHKRLGSDFRLWFSDVSVK